MSALRIVFAEEAGNFIKECERLDDGETLIVLSGVDKSRREIIIKNTAQKGKSSFLAFLSKEYPRVDFFVRKSFPMAMELERKQFGSVAEVLRMVTLNSGGEIEIHHNNKVYVACDRPRLI